MDFYRNHRSGTSAQSRLIGLLSRPGGDSIAGNSGVGVELHEDELFWTGSDSPEPIITQKPSSAATLATENPNRRSSPFRRIPEKNSGILAALVEDDKKLPGADVAAAPLLQRKPSTAASSASTSPSSARMIPAIPKPKTDYGGGKPFHQSAPVNIPIPPRFARHRYEDSVGAGEVDEADGDDEMLPPHEIIARRSGLGTPMTSFSVLEGVGRTLKGRDLRQVRNAVFRKTGFLD